MTDAAIIVRSVQQQLRLLQITLWCQRPNTLLARSGWRG